MKNLYENFIVVLTSFGLGMGIVGVVLWLMTI